MSITSSSTLDSQLTTVWSPTHSYPDGELDTKTQILHFLGLFVLFLAKKKHSVKLKRLKKTRYDVLLKDFD